MLDTRLTELLGCRYPVVQTAMGWIADPKLVASTCNAGGFGFLAGATIPAEQMERDILRTKELTSQPFGVNFHMYQPNAADIVALVVRLQRGGRPLPAALRVARQRENIIEVN